MVKILNNYCCFFFVDLSPTKSLEKTLQIVGKAQFFKFQNISERVKGGTVVTICFYSICCAPVSVNEYNNLKMNDYDFKEHEKYISCKKR